MTVFWPQVFNCTDLTTARKRGLKKSKTCAKKLHQTDKNETHNGKRERARGDTQRAGDVGLGHCESSTISVLESQSWIFLLNSFYFLLHDVQ